MRRMTVTLVLIALASVASPAVAANYHIAGPDHFGCVSKSYFKQIVAYAADKDVVAFKKALASGILLGECTMFKSGEIVFLSDTSIFSGMVQVRRAGDTIKFWTNIETLGDQAGNDR